MMIVAGNLNEADFFLISVEGIALGIDTDDRTVFKLGNRFIPFLRSGDVFVIWNRNLRLFLWLTLGQGHSREGGNPQYLLFLRAVY